MKNKPHAHGGLSSERERERGRERERDRDRQTETEQTMQRLLSREQLHYVCNMVGCQNQVSGQSPHAAPGVGIPIPDVINKMTTSQ